MKVILSPRARRDLAEIKDYYLRENPAGADKVRRSIAAAIDLLAFRPDLGPRDFGTELRSKLILRYPYRIHYRVKRSGLEVVHIRHTSRREWIGRREP
jgi:plasmid stabilization system protein ParE